MLVRDTYIFLQLELLTLPVANI